MEDPIPIPLLFLANLISLLWTAFSLEASLYRLHWYYNTIHESDVHWFASWYSCQTFAALVSLTNITIICIYGWNVWNWALGRRRRLSRNFGEYNDKKFEDGDEGEVLEEIAEREKDGKRDFSNCSSRSGSIVSSPTNVWEVGMAEKGLLEYYREIQGEGVASNGGGSGAGWDRGLGWWCWGSRRARGRGKCGGRAIHNCCWHKMSRWGFDFGVTVVVTMVVGATSWYFGTFPFRATIAVVLERREQDVIIPWNG